MTTLAVNKARPEERGNHNHFPVVAADIIYQGAAVGLVKASGHARPLTSVDKFVGFNIKEKTDNSQGAAADINVEVERKGVIQLAVTGAVITDVGLPVYATDDNAFSFSPVGGVFVGIAKRFVSAGVMMVAYDVDNLEDPFAGWTWEAISADKTLDAEDHGKAFFVTADAKTITVPATATALRCLIMNGGAFGTIAVNISPNANDKIMGPDLAGVDNKDLINTKATACRGDYAIIRNGHADGPVVDELRGTWAAEA